ncbi:oligopeptide/dipeptide ABC transporter ATP-binding protein [Pseudoroseomonas cervicalis]|uniref:oligopeptide/dipeptide ABC transporter ATP-binding protein n=1 Tax=Teichococcus cervicalis TaxID=204525 RepID=UPI0035EB9847
MPGASSSAPRPPRCSPARSTPTYTLALLAAMPSLTGAQARLEPIPGRMPAPGEAPPGCRFAPRCPFAAAECAATPPLRALAPGHAVACWRAPVETLSTGRAA